MPTRPDLLSLQGAFARNALDDIDAAGVEPAPPPLLLESVAARGVPVERRLAIHRNHYATSLVESLAGIFAATRALVGPGYFDAFARRFVRATPPRGPCLFEYGAGFPEALAAGPGMAGHGYVAAVARLEWAMHESFHAPAGPSLAPSRLTSVPSDAMTDIRLRLHATARLFQADFPVDRLWRAALDGAAEAALLQGPAATVLLIRPDLDVEMHGLEPGTHALLAALAGGATLGQAAAAAMEAETGFDFGAVLQWALVQGVFADVIEPGQ